MLRACEVCGRKVDVVGVSESGPALCDFCAWTAQQEQVKRERSGDSPQRRRTGKPGWRRTGRAELPRRPPEDEEMSVLLALELLIEEGLP
jgi:ribosome-binding protein aMBF1 (putative translation factor)